MFVEEDRQSAEMIECNLAKTKLKGRVRQQNVFDFFRHASDAETFQVIFAAPPSEKTNYGETYSAKLLTSEALSRLLRSGGVFALEKRPNETIPETNLCRIIRGTAYGVTEVL